MIRLTSSNFRWCLAISQTPALSFQTTLFPPRAVLTTLHTHTSQTSSENSQDQHLLYVCIFFCIQEHQPTIFKTLLPLLSSHNNFIRASITETMGTDLFILICSDFLKYNLSIQLYMCDDKLLIS